MNNQNYNCDRHSYIDEIICRIIELQCQDFDNELGCDRPFLGPNSNNTSYNTRPVQLYNRYTGEPWAFNYILNETTSSTNTFRIESVEQCSVTVRLLAQDASTSTYTNINQFATIDLSSIGAIRCFADIYITL